MVIVATVGMPGSGKSEAADVFIAKGFDYIRFGKIVVSEVKKRGLPVEEDYERQIREEFRERYGMAAMAILNIPKIEASVKAKNDVLIDGLYSWEELIVLRERFPGLKLLAVYASPETRAKRLAKRKIRPLTAEELSSRDRAEIENLHKGGPIAIADYTVLNETTKPNFLAEVKKIVTKIKRKK
ncbi:MAG: dephospho-CoA kinase [Candidatus Diapherotrites archaeon]|uniref:Dephospho-CoA kinase n=1 Tax=Candidatus Iainarchaeum sp. TaxID=3101447 RepID=A0A2D6M1Y1_9ARCH|nr:dephospho-CoA kinase [Candidatus Diapherotrites archaeon]|tara:strand:+ start:4144 stop:4695 length:552 start_codon:yes stop_codon:yes gene_type:complete